MNLFLMDFFFSFIVLDFFCIDNFFVLVDGSKKQNSKKKKK